MQKESESRWRLNGVRVIHANELDINTPQTPGMNRAAAITYARTSARNAERTPLFVALRGGRGYAVVADRRISARVVERVLRRRAVAARIDGAATLSVHRLRAGTPSPSTQP